MAQGSLYRSGNNDIGLAGYARAAKAAIDGQKNAIKDVFSVAKTDLDERADIRSIEKNEFIDSLDTEQKFNAAKAAGLLTNASLSAGGRINKDVLTNARGQENDLRLALQADQKFQDYKIGQSDKDALDPIRARLAAMNAQQKTDFLSNPLNTNIEGVSSAGMTSFLNNQKGIASKALPGFLAETNRKQGVESDVYLNKFAIDNPITADFTRKDYNDKLRADIKTRLFAGSALDGKEQIALMNQSRGVVTDGLTIDGIAQGAINDQKEIFKNDIETGTQFAIEDSNSYDSTGKSLLIDPTKDVDQWREDSSGVMDLIDGYQGDSTKWRIDDAAAADDLRRLAGHYMGVGIQDPNDPNNTYRPTPGAVGLAIKTLMEDGNLVYDEGVNKKDLHDMVFAFASQDGLARKHARERYDAQQGKIRYFQQNGKNAQVMYNRALENDYHNGTNTAQQVYDDFQKGIGGGNSGNNGGEVTLPANAQDATALLQGGAPQDAPQVNDTQVPIQGAKGGAVDTVNQLISGGGQQPVQPEPKRVKSVEEREVDARVAKLRAEASKNNEGTIPGFISEIATEGTKGLGSELYKVLSGEHLNNVPGELKQIQGAIGDSIENYGNNISNRAKSTEVARKQKSKSNQAQRQITKLNKELLTASSHAERVKIMNKIKTQENTIEDYSKWLRDLIATQ